MTTGPLDLDVTAGDDDGFTVPGPALGDLGQPGARLHVVVEQRPRRASMLGALRGLPGVVKLERGDVRGVVVTADSNDIERLASAMPTVRLVTRPHPTSEAEFVAELP